LNPFLWLCGISSPLCLGMAYVFLMKGAMILCYFIVAIGLLPIPITCAIGIGFAWYCPEKLQSEEYQLRLESLQIIQQKTGQLTIAPTSLEAIANPTVPRLPGGEHQ